MPVDVNQILRLLKRYLVPQARKWWKKRKQQQQQQAQQGGQHGGGQASYSSAAGAQQQYNGPPQQQYYPQQQQQQQQQSSYGPPQGGLASSYYGPGPQPQSSWGPPPSQSHGPQQSHPSFHQGQTEHFGPHGPSHQNQDQINASNESYVQLRKDAIRAGDLMHQAFEAASRAHDAGDGGEAKRLSNEGHEHQRRRDQLNAQAADWIFNENNKRSPRGTIDLHGLFVQEAIARAEDAVRDGQSQGLDELRVITGKGLHSTQHVAKIKPAIEQLMVNLSAHVDSHNTGVLIVNLRGGGSRDVGFADELADQADGDKCTIM